jgi:hypothetical protein
MDVKEIQAAGIEIARLIRQRPYDDVAVAEQLRRWDTAGLPRHDNKQIARMIDDLLYDLGGPGRGKSSYQVASGRKAKRGTRERKKQR